MPFLRFYTLGNLEVLVLHVSFFAVLHCLCPFSCVACLTGRCQNIMPDIQFYSLGRQACFLLVFYIEMPQDVLIERRRKILVPFLCSKDLSFRRFSSSVFCVIMRNQTFFCNFVSFGLLFVLYTCSFFFQGYLQCFVVHRFCCRI